MKKLMIASIIILFETIGYSQDIESIVTATSSFESDITVLKKNYTDDGSLVAGPYSGSVGEGSPYVSALVTFLLTSNKTYRFLIIVDKKKCNTEAILVKFEREYTVNGSIKVQKPDPMEVKRVVTEKGKHVSQKHNMYWGTFETGANFKSARLLAYNGCKWSPNARIFILEED